MDHFQILIFYLPHEKMSSIFQKKQIFVCCVDHCILNASDTVTNKYLLYTVEYIQLPASVCAMCESYHYNKRSN